MNRPLDPNSMPNAMNAPSMRSQNQEATPPRLRATPPAMPRRSVVDMPSSSSPVSSRGRPDQGPRFSQHEGRRMVVAKEITLSGQISKCDHLIVEGVVENMRYDGQSLEVVDGGVFNGTIEVENAIIAGSFDGTMTVKGQMIVRATGRVTGTIRYGEIEVNAGGQLNGELQTIVQKVERAGYRGGASIDSMLGDSEEDSSGGGASNNVQRIALSGE